MSVIFHRRSKVLWVPEGWLDGWGVGCLEGWFDGFIEGRFDGFIVGCGVGFIDGRVVGCIEGCPIIKWIRIINRFDYDIDNNNTDHHQSNLP